MPTNVSNLPTQRNVQPTPLQNADINGSARNVVIDLNKDPSPGAAQQYNKDMDKLLGDVQGKTQAANQALGADEQASLNSVDQALKDASARHPDLAQGFQMDAAQLGTSELTGSQQEAIHTILSSGGGGGTGE